jgi:nuclear polyadenylated RNA-binding protein 3
MKVIDKSTGNLPTEKVTKRDLFHVFHKYGRLAQVSIKQAYGFVQFHDVASCYNALEVEQGAEVRGRKMRRCNQCRAL